MKDQFSYEANFDLSKLDLSDFINGNISEAVEVINEARKTGDYNYICSRILENMQMHTEAVEAGVKDSSSHACFSLRKAVKFISWGVEYHVVELMNKQGNMLPWVVSILDLLNFMSQCHEKQIPLTAENVQILYDTADEIRNLEKVTGLSFPLSPRLTPPSRGGEGIHLHTARTSKGVISCSEGDYYKSMVRTLNKGTNFIKVAFLVVILGAMVTAIVYGMGKAVEASVPNVHLGSLELISPIVGGVLALAYGVWKSYSLSPNSKRMQITLQSIHNDWLHNPTHGTVKPTDLCFTNMTNIILNRDGKYIISDKR